MKKCIVALSLALSLLALFPGPAQATEVGTSRNFGLGFQVGSPTAIVGKVFIDRGTALDFGVGFGGFGWRERCWDRPHDNWYYCDGRYRNWSVHLDYLWEDTLAQGSAKLDYHIGLGGRIIFWDRDLDHHYFGDNDQTGLIFRVPLGLDLTFRRPDFMEVFFEVMPGFLLVPVTDFNVDVSAGLRFYF